MRILFYILFTSLCLNLYAQNKETYTVSGKIKDASTSEELIGVTIIVKEIPNTGAISNEYGFYSLTLPKGNYTLEIFYVGYRKTLQTIQLDKNITLDLRLDQDEEMIEEIELIGQNEKSNVEDLKMSSQEVDVEQIKKLPALFGEVDVIKNIQMLPGIQVAGEGNTGLFVRGGGADQNLILLDEAPVYNASHLLGIFSVFNAEAIKHAEIYKGGIPAQHGGRLSSLLDIRTRDGNKNKITGTGGVGTISSRLTLEGPIKKDKSSFIISGRRTYGDLFLKFSPDKDIRKNKLYFYDLNAKANFEINAKNKIFLAGYFGRDVLSFSDLFGLDWGNTTGTVRWNHLINDKLFSNTTLIYSNFIYNSSFDVGVQSAKFTTGLNETSIKQDFSWFLNPSNEISFGATISKKNFAPGKFSPIKESSIFKEVSIDKYHSLDGAIYLSNKQKITSKFSAEYGLRLSLFSQVGKGPVYHYSGELLEKNITDTTNYSNLERIKTYGGLEPRISTRYILTETSSIKASYNRMYQYIHLISNSTSPLPANMWVPSTNYIKPEKADQVAAGYFRNFKNNKFEFSLEGYYKWMQNVIDFKDNAQLILNPHIETEIKAGKSWSYGMELFLKKSVGKTTGWVSYTLSKTQRKIPGVNSGRTYYASYDRRHNINIVFSHDFSERCNLSANWVFGTGRPINLPVAKYQLDYTYAELYPERNSYRIKDYHRFDVAFTMKNKKKEGQKWEGSWNFSVYNLYARKNPYTLFTRDKPNHPGQKEVRMIYFPAPIPSITYNFKF